MANHIATWPSGTRVVWKALSWGQFRKARSHSGPSAEVALEVYKLCLINGPAPEVVSAGIASWICKYELEQSVFTGEFTKISGPIQQNRDAIANDYLSAAQALIVAVFRIPFSEMDSWDADTFLKRLAQAEFISGRPLDPVDPRATIPVNKRPKKALTPAQQIAVDRKRERDSITPKR